MIRWFDSLQIRLLVGTAAATTVVFVGAGIALYVTVRAQLISDLGASLKSEVQAVAGMFERGADGRLDLGLDQWGRQDFNNSFAHTYYEVWSINGTMLAKSPLLHKADLIPNPGLCRVPTTLSVKLGCHTDVLAAGLTVVPPTDPNDDVNGSDTDDVGPSITGRQGAVTLVIAQRMVRIDDTLTDLAGLLVLIWLAAIVVEVSVLAWVVRRGLRPAKALADQVARIDGSNLSQRIQLRRAPGELMPVMERLNDLLGRVQSAFAHEKAFLGQVAHELRTPLAGLRSTLEVALSKPRDAEAYRQDMEQLLEISRDMQTMVDNLLALARMDTAHLGSESQDVPVAGLINECWQAYAQRAAERQLRVDWQVAASAVARIDVQRFRILLRNLLENAVTYAAKGGQLGVSVAMKDSWVQMELANDGCRVSSANASQVFERFWRGDPARGGEGGHCGLGLALCKQIVEGAGGWIAVQCERGQRFQVTVRLPAAERAVATSLASHD